MFDRIIAIGGPTGSGKSSLAMELARRTGGEIVSCDSMQIYKGLDVGTAKPAKEDTEAVRHWLIDIKEPCERYSVADYVEDARNAISDINGRGLPAIVCGGTGLYMSSLLSGIEFPEASSRDDELRLRLTSFIDMFGTDTFLRKIASADPAYAEKLKPNDVKRIVRAMEIIESGSTPSEQIAASKGEGYPDAVKILVSCSSREALYKRIEDRCDAMMRDGIVDEARYVYDNRGSFATASAAIGYKEFFGFFEGRSSLDECLSELKKATRHYAKRQLTWFRREKDFTALFSDITDTEKMADQAIGLADRSISI
ncbi:MAG: tRNA (adenosine(37)-N6)-dimethylallyltransferase MiaA [Oscillospiraceae bacterium]|nr:tRNA (adenosine(37)-N6)-dimethylallyltransferase MiaA [Oscillospiraceae bacterium]MBR5980031.1 tRNA (adenosine(37)-N6)-dimethylallyltransferase MiaA [Oscillospiraceae bacterium]